MRHTGEVGSDYETDGQYSESKMNVNGELIGIDANRDMSVHPTGLRKILNWIDKRYPN